MSSAPSRLKWKRYLLRILLPTGLAIALFVAFIFVVIIPEVETNLLDRKRDMIRELTRSAVSILREYRAEERAGRLSRLEAQRSAVERLRDLRYGPEDKDYFWITDSRPVMIMHPFRTDLNGQDVSTFQDPLGNRVFVEFVNRVKAEGSGYVDYVWQWKDNPTRLVAKESFVMGFPDWDWVLGTGIYTDDVKAEIAGLTGKLVSYSLGIIAVVILILGFIAWQSLKIERQRLNAEEALRFSHEKYRTLVEASADGTVLVLGGALAFANRTLQEMLGYSQEDFEALSFEQLFLADKEASEALAYQDAVLHQAPAPPHLETVLRCQDGSPLEAIVAASRVALGGQVGTIVNVRDLSGRRQVESELGYSRERYRALRESIEVGVLRCTASAPHNVLEANPAALRLLGVEGEAGLANLDLAELLLDPETRQSPLRDLPSGTLKNRAFVFRRRDGGTGQGRLTAVTARDENGNPRFLDLLLEDLTEQHRQEQERETLIGELQTSLLFLNEPVRRYAREVPNCEMTTPIRQVAQRLEGGDGAALVVTEGRDPVGLVSDSDLRQRVLAAGLDPEAPVFRIMSAPVVAVSDRALVYEALQVMRDKGLQRLAVKDDSGRILGLIRQSDLSQFHRYSSAVLVQEIRRANSVEELGELHGRLPILVRTLMDCGARPRNVNRVITAVSDAITERLLTLVQLRLGPPPVRFAFLALGSEGREEQTLVTDQDNAIVYEDPETDGDQVAYYFHRLALEVCDALNQVGYAWCVGEVMAKNPRWCQPLARWQQYFSEWLAARNPQDLLAVHMFFDFRCIAGDQGLTGALRRHVQDELAQNPGFFPVMAQDAMSRRPPTALFGGLPTTSEARGGKGLSLKDAMMPFVGFARLYSLRHAVADTNTFDRLSRLHEKGFLSRSSLEEITDAYAFLMQTRLRHQALAVARQETPDNVIQPKTLSPSEETLIKKTLAHVSVLAKKVSFDFPGSQQM